MKIDQPMDSGLANKLALEWVHAGLGAPNSDSVVDIDAASLVYLCAYVLKHTGNTEIHPDHQARSSGRLGTPFRKDFDSGLD